MIGRENQLMYARNLGQKAYLAGKACTPSSDKELNEFFSHRGHDKYLSLDVHASSDEILSAYRAGYDSNNSNRIDPNKLGL